MPVSSFEVPVSSTLGISVNPAKLDAANDEVVTAASAGQTGGLTMFHAKSAATINDTVVKASAGRLYGWHIANSNAAARFVKFYDKATAPDPSAGDLPKWVHFVAGSAVAAFPLVFPHGLAFANGIGFVAVALLADTDETAIGANDLIINLAYK